MPGVREEEEGKRGPVKKTVIAAGLLILALPGFLLADEIQLGLEAGYRQLRDSSLRPVYGDGIVAVPYLQYYPFRLYGVELAYEAGYRREGRIGLFQEKSTLKVSGIHLCGVFRYPVWKLLPFFKLGVGRFSYVQDIDSPFVRFKVDHSAWTTVVALGVGVAVSERIFLQAQVKNVPLKVQPFDIGVDLGGLRVLVGAGYAFFLRD